jgi:hypothetical protein
MRAGVVYPQVELGGDTGAVKAFAQAAEDLGYDHIVIYDHVLGAHAEGQGNVPRGQPRLSTSVVTIRPRVSEMSTAQRRGGGRSVGLPFSAAPDLTILVLASRQLRQALA